MLEARNWRPVAVFPSAWSLYLSSVSLNSLYIKWKGESVLINDVEAVERAESEIDRFISKRDREREEANRTEEMWRASERRVREKRRQENRQAWADFHGRMNVLHTALALEHADKRSRLMLEAEPGESPGPEAA